MCGAHPNPPAPAPHPSVASVHRRQQRRKRRARGAAADEPLPECADDEGTSDGSEEVLCLHMAVPMPFVQQSAFCVCSDPSDVDTGRE